MTCEFSTPHRYCVAARCSCHSCDNKGLYNGCINGPDFVREQVTRLLREQEESDQAVCVVVFPMGKMFIELE